MINSELESGNWNDQKTILKQKFAVLTGNDSMFEEDKKDLVLQNLQNTLGKSKEELAALISNL